MTSVIVDTGPIVALLSRRERHHAWAAKVMDTIEPPIFTCDAVLSEACFLLQDSKGGPDAVLELVRMTELNQRSVVLTLDSDFKIYRRNKRQMVPTRMPHWGGGG